MEKYNLNLVAKKVKFYSKDYYSWVEEIEYKTCENIKEVEEYYVLSGVYLCIFYILSSYDMHFENLISNASTPVIIDFETLSYAPRKDVLEKNNFKNIVDSILNTSFIPYINNSGVFDVNVSGILSESDTSNTEQLIYTFDMLEGFKTKKVKSCFYINNQVSLNNLNVIDKEISLDQIRILLREGFYNSSNIILNNTQHIKTIIETYMNNNSLQLRQLLRPTQVYYEFIKACKNPEALKSSINRDKILMILQNNFVPTDFGYLRIEEEIKNLEKEYIPKFYTYGNSTDLYSNGNIICKDYFRETALDQALKKIDKLNKEQIDYQARLIDLSILTLTDKDKFGKTTVLNKPLQDEKINNQFVHNIITEIMSELNKSVIWYNDEINSMFVPHLSDTKRMWNLNEIGLNLYEDGGIIMLFAAYGYSYNDINSIETSAKLINYLNILKDDPKIENQSIFTGKGSLLYLNYNIYKIIKNLNIKNLKCNEYKKMFTLIADNLLDVSLEKELSKADFDFLHGIISSIYFICNTCLDDKDLKDHFSDKLNILSEKIVQNINCDWFNEFGYAHGITGTILCLSSLYRICGNDALLNLIISLAEKENTLIEKEEINDISTSWCRGINGIILGRTLCFENINDLTNTEENQIKNIILKFDKDMFKFNMFNDNNLCLCHGIYGTIEIANKLKLDSDLMYKKYFNSFKDLIWVDSLNIPINTFMLANTGIAYVLLELVNKDIPSILSLDTFK
nr:type 2 lanthipeptide synthetase LanM [Clostridium perfringens]